MSFEIQKEQKPQPAGALVSDRRLWVTDDKSQVVEDGDTRARCLFATPGTEIPASEVARLGLSMRDGCVVLPGSKKAAKAAKVDEPNNPPVGGPPVNEPKAPAKAAKKPKGRQSKKGG